MAREDDFSIPIKTELARRAGYKCSFLGCGAATIGPSEESESASTNSGMACHISAASSGINSRRFDPDMSPETRRSLSNGIWMCYTHGKIIDTDETRFTSPMLTNWRQIAERVAQIMVEKNVTYPEALNSLNFSNLIVNSFSIDGVGSENTLIGEAIHDCGLEIVWGKEISIALRDFFIEHSRNAFQHGNATNIIFEAVNNKLILSDNGAEFNAKSLLNSDKKSGGTISINQLLKNHGTNLLMTSERIDNHNVIIVSKLRNPEEILKITPCSYQMKHEDFRKGTIELKINETCNEIFIIMPKYTSASDIGLLGRKLKGLEEINKPLTFLIHRMSPWVIEMLKENYKSCHVIELD